MMVCETDSGFTVNHVRVLFTYLFWQLPPAPPPPPFPEGYAPPASAEGETGGSEGQQADAQLPAVDPILDQGPSKRMKF